MGDDEGESFDPILIFHHIADAPGVGTPLHSIVELEQESDGFFCAVFAYAVPAFEEKVVTCVGGRYARVVDDGKVTDTGQDEVLEDRGGSRVCTEDEDASQFKRGLP